MQNSFAGRAAPGKTIFVAGCWLEYPWTVLHLKGGALMRAAFLLSIILMEKSTVLFARLSAPRTTKPAVAPCRHHPLTPLPLLHLPLDTGRHSDPITVSSPMRTGLTQLTTQPFLPRFSQCKLHSTPHRMLKFTITKQISFILACPSERLNTSTRTVQKNRCLERAYRPGILPQSALRTYTGYSSQASEHSLHTRTDITLYFTELNTERVPIEYINIFIIAELARNLIILEYLTLHSYRYHHGTGIAIVIPDNMILHRHYNFRSLTFGPEQSNGQIIPELLPHSIHESPCNYRLPPEARYNTGYTETNKQCGDKADIRIHHEYHRKRSILSKYSNSRIEIQASNVLHLVTKHFEHCTFNPSKQYGSSKQKGSIARPLVMAALFLALGLLVLRRASPQYTNLKDYTLSVNALLPTHIFMTVRQMLIFKLRTRFERQPSPLFIKGKWAHWRNYSRRTPRKFSPKYTK